MVASSGVCPMLARLVIVCFVPFACLNYYERILSANVVEQLEKEVLWKNEISSSIAPLLPGFENTGMHCARMVTNLATS